MCGYPFVSFLGIGLLDDMMVLFLEYYVPLAVVGLLVWTAVLSL